MMQTEIVSRLINHTAEFFPVVPFQKGIDKLAALDLSASNTSFTDTIYQDLALFTQFINDQRKQADARYLLGGYAERRDMYRRSNLFDRNHTDNHTVTEEPRSLHLGIDIWGDAGTPVFAPLGGMVHSFAYNNQLGDYGATIILQHQLETINFYTLYGHLSLADITGLRTGRFYTRGETIAHLGNPEENGQWPPHLHFQLILDIGNSEGDYPGVCKPSEAAKYLENSPDPSFLLNFGH